MGGVGKREALTDGGESFDISNPMCQKCLSDDAQLTQPP